MRTNLCLVLKNKYGENMLFRIKLFRLSLFLFLCSVSVVGAYKFSLSNIRDCITFWKAAVKNFKQIGAIVPSSQALAELITKYSSTDLVVGKRKILEVGAGTGVFTEKLVRNLKKGDILDVVELDEQMCCILRKKFQNYHNVRIYNISILDWHPSYKYDCIVSGLPFNSFDGEFVDKVLSKYLDLLKENGIISYFEYCFFPVLKRCMTSLVGGRNSIKEVQEVVKQFKNRFLFEKQRVWKNLPPANVYFLAKKNELVRNRSLGIEAAAFSLA